MAKYKVLNKDVKRNIYEFLVDKTSDLNNLPKAAGSTALVADNGEKYICNNAKEWKILSNTNTSPGSNSGDSNIDGGAGGGVMIVTMNDNTSELSASYDELKSALSSGKHIDFMSVVSMPNEESVSVHSLTAITYVNNLYSAFFGDDFHFISDSSTEPMEASIG